MELKEKQPGKRKRRKEKEEIPPTRKEEVIERGEEIEKRLKKLDEIIDDVLAEAEENPEEEAQRFVDGFKQEGGE
jgi:hypothetical protein